MANEKGGVGRTTLAVNIVDRLAARNRRVLLVDTTGQGGVTAALDVDTEDAFDLTDVLKGRVSLPEATLSPASFDILVGPRDVDETTDLVSDDVTAMVRFAASIVAPAKARFDHIVVDTPPTTSALGDAALAAADQVLLPSGLNHADLHALARTIEHQIVPIRREKALPIAGIVPNRVRGTAEEDRSLGALSRSELGDLLLAGPNGDVLAIHERTAIQESWNAGEPFAEYAPSDAMVDRFDQLAAAVSRGGVGA